MLNRSSLTAADLISTDPQPFNWRMGVRPLRLEQWLLVDADRDADLNDINAIIDRHRDEIIYCEPTAAAACKELATLVSEHLRQVPQLSKVELNSRPDMHIIEATRRLVQEDICLLERRSEGWVMTACAVAIPTQWMFPQSSEIRLTPFMNRCPDMTPTSRKQWEPSLTGFERIDRCGELTAP